MRFVATQWTDDLLFFSGEVRFIATQWTTYSSFLEK